MSDSGHQSRPPSGASPHSASPLAETKVFRSLKPGELGASRMNPVNEERQSAADQIQRSMKAWRSASGGATGAPNIPQGGGKPLATDVRARMEPKLGASLGGVKVHTGGESAQAAKDLGARAFTVGDEVHFNDGEYAPGTKEGDKLIAHELTHVVQGQKSGIQRKAEEGGEDKGGAEVSEPGEPAEKEADAVADGVADKLHGKKDDKDKEGGESKENADPEAEQGKAALGDKADAAKEKGDKEGKEGADAGEVKEAAPAIGAKLEGVGRKVYLAKKAPAGGGAAPAAGGAVPKTWDPNKNNPFTHPKYQEFKNRCGSLNPPIGEGEAKALWSQVMSAVGIACMVPPKPENPTADQQKDYDNKIDNAKSAWDGIAQTMLAGRFAKDGAKDYCLWSGETPAQQYAVGKGFTTLESTQAGKLFNGLDILDNNWGAMQYMWAALSKAYAKMPPLATVHAYQRWVGGTFKGIELPTLLDRVKEAEAKAPGSAAKFKIVYHGLVSPEKNSKDKSMTAADLKEIGPFGDQGSMEAALAAENKKNDDALAKKGKKKP